MQVKTPTQLSWSLVRHTNAHIIMFICVMYLFSKKKKKKEKSISYPDLTVPLNKRCNQI